MPSFGVHTGLHTAIVAERGARCHGAHLVAGQADVHLAAPR